MSPETRTSVPSDAEPAGAVRAGSRAVAGAGAAAGLAATLAGYLVLLVVHGDRLDEAVAGINAILGLLGTETIPTWKLAGWLYFDLHHAPVSLSLPGRSTVTRSLVGGDGASAIWFLLPPLLLAFAGAAVARYAGARGPRAGGLAGVAIVPAVLVAAVVGVLATRTTLGDATVGPDLATGVLLAGIGYPVVFGAAGGVLGGLFGAEAR